MADPGWVETRTIIEDCGVLIEDDHFVHTSGHHGNGWITRDIINPDPSPISISMRCADQL